MLCVDLGDTFPTSIYLQKSASIQPRTSPSKFWEKFNSFFICLLSYDFHHDSLDRRATALLYLEGADGGEIVRSAYGAAESGSYQGEPIFSPQKSINTATLHQNGDQSARGNSPQRSGRYSRSCGISPRSPRSLRFGAGIAIRN